MVCTDFKASGHGFMQLRVVLRLWSESKNLMTWETPKIVNIYRQKKGTHKN